MDEISTSSATRIDEATSRLERQQLKLQEGGGNGGHGGVAVDGEQGGWGEGVHGSGGGGGGETKDWKPRLDEAGGSAPNELPEDSHKEAGAAGYGPRYAKCPPVLATVHYTDFPLSLSLLRSKKTSIGKNAGRKNAKRRLRRLPIVRMLQAYKQADPNVPHNCVLVRWAAYM